MIVDRYPPVNLFAVVPKLVADFEPELRELDRLLEDDELFERVKKDLSCRRPHSLTRGRHSTPVEVILRLLVVKRLYRWSYEQTEHFVGDSLVLRQFCRLYWRRSRTTRPCCGGRSSSAPPRWSSSTSGWWPGLIHCRSRAGASCGWIAR
jgi:hypothetical protein